MLEEWLPLANESLLCYSSFKLKKTFKKKESWLSMISLISVLTLSLKSIYTFCWRYHRQILITAIFKKKKLQSVIYDNLYNARPLNSISFKRVQNFLQRFLFFLLNRTKVIKIKLTVVSFISSHPQNWLLFTLWLTSN